ncbi:hypothetical protein Tco_0568750 [Tanacetum coccineum]
MLPRVIITDRELALIGALSYVDEQWLNKYKEMFVSAWTDQSLNFGIQNVGSDGNCGFRVVALGLGISEDQWPRISTVKFAGRWMEIPYTGLVITSVYKKVVVNLSDAGGCNTSFPLWSRPSQSDSHETIVVAHVDGNHYIRVALREGFPLPLTHHLWITYRSDIASGWEDKFVSRQNEFREYYYRTPERDENPIRTLGDYSKPSHEGYRNTIELPMGTTWTAKLRNDILMFQKHHGESLSEAWTRFKDLLQKVPHHGIDLWLQALLEDLTLYDNESWNDPRDFAKPVKAIALPQDVPSTSDRRLIELENQVQRLMEAHLAPTQPTQVNKVTTSCEICSGPHDTQYCMKDLEQAFLEKALDDFNSHQEKRLSHLRTQLEQQQDDMIGNINLLWKTRYQKGGAQKKGNKSQSKLRPLKYLSSASKIKLDKNPLAPKRIHFINSIIILSEESKAEEGETTIDITPEHDHNITKETKDEVNEVIDEEESEVETDEEIEEIPEEEEEGEDGEYFNSFPTMNELTHHE